MKTLTAIAIVLLLSAPALAGHGGCGCGEPAGCATCDATPECGCKKLHLPKIHLHDLFGGLFQCNKCCKAKTCSTCEAAPEPEPAPCNSCGCEKKCGHHFKLFQNLFKSKCGCDSCGDAGDCGCNGEAINEIAPQPMQEGAPEVPPPPAPHEEDAAAGKSAGRGYQRMQLAPQLYRDEDGRASRQINSQPINNSPDFEVNQPSTRSYRNQWPVR